MTPRVPEEWKPRANSRGLGPPTSIRTSHARRTNIPPGGSEAAACPAGAGLPLEDSPTHRIQCGWLRRALPAWHTGQPLSGLTVDRVLPRTQCSRLRRAHVEPVCRINWIRRHGTFPSCRLRRKLHDLFSYITGDAASYPWRRFDKTGQSAPVGRFPRTNQENPGIRSPSPATP